MAQTLETLDLTSAAAQPLPTTGAAPGHAAKRKFAASSGKKESAKIIMLYGTGGVGKTTLAALAPRPRLIDIEQGSGNVDIDRVELGDGAAWTFSAVREALQTPDLWANHDTVVIDSVTKLEELAAKHVCETIPDEKKGTVSSIEDYGWGHGPGYLYDAFLLFLADVQALKRAGKNVVLIAHDCIVYTDNPMGKDFVRYEPRLSSPNSGKSSIRLKAKEEVDGLFYIGYDVAVDKDGKATGSGSRRIYTSETPAYMAKHRGVPGPVPYKNATDATLWGLVFNSTKKGF